MPDKTFTVILTHEHTDFDALASMLGASILYPDALPVLPRQLNRNVREFLVLYKNHLPFVTDRDVPKGRVARAILVDARSVNWIKGMDRDVEMFIIDHHTVDSSPNGAREHGGTTVGANTTLLVEKLIELDYSPSAVELTLLALGIHEDTGSLTYPSTTYRDARCLAWLMKHPRKVNLDVLGHFLNHPLSPDQRALLHQLIDRSEFIDIAGHKIVIAQAEATGFREELSALASRLRDFHETDAVFLIVNLGDIVQVVARSTTDEIDVGEIATTLGGGGHARAAAAPLQAKDADTADVRNRIVRLVSESGASAQTVRQIMSTGRPQILPPGMTVNEAAELMRRYGHEGFPVVRKQDDGSEELLGVLTRREADRAISHELGDQPVTRYMRAGSVTVRPDDSVASLRRKMVDSSWGQIPVVDDGGRIIGIVTRTDLIKLWDESDYPSRYRGHVEERLRNRLPPLQYDLLRLVGEEVDQLEYTVYLVGGFVRDLLIEPPAPLGQGPDMDIVIEGDAIALAKHIQGHFGGRVVPHGRFNTAKWLLDDPDHVVDLDTLRQHLQSDGDLTDLPGHLDFVSARTEFYTAPTVLPTVENSSIKLDLHRRDFTINTLAICLNPDRWGELLDFYGGLNDLQRGLIRVLHSISFVDDPTRILRAVRYEQRFHFKIEPRTMELLRDAVPLLDRVSGARIRHELERILKEERPELSLQRLWELGVLQRLHPELVVDQWVARKFVELREALAAPNADPELTIEPIERLYWGLLVFRLPQDAQTVLNDRLGLRGVVQRMSRDLARIHAGMPALERVDLMPSQVATILDRVGSLSIAIAKIACSEQPTVLHWLDEYDGALRHVHPDIDGNDLRAMGIPKGPVYSKILSALRGAKLDGVTRNREQQIALAVDVAHGLMGAEKQ